MKRAVFLDRDGVVNEAMIKDGKPYPPPTLSQVIIPHDVPPALSLLKKHGFMLFIVTNQPDVARGTQTQENVTAINQYLSSQLPLDDCRVCYHDNADNCECRKPKPGMLLELAQTHRIQLSKSFMIGDRSGDIEAGSLAGCKTVFLDHGYREKQPTKYNKRVQTFAEAVSFILEQD